MQRRRRERTAQAPASWVVGLKVAVALAHALIPLYFAHSLVAAPQRPIELGQPLILLLRAFPLVSVGILTYELLLLRRYPDRPLPMLAILLAPPSLFLLQGLLRTDVAAPTLWLEGGAFYLGLFLLTVIALSAYRLFVERIVEGWEWIPVLLALGLLLGPGITAEVVFFRVLIAEGALAGPRAFSLFLSALALAVVCELRLVLREWPARRGGERAALRTAR